MKTITHGNTISSQYHITLLGLLLVLSGMLARPLQAQTLPHHGTATSSSTLWWITQLGLGSAGEFQINNAGNSNPALFATTNGSGPALRASAGSGLAGEFDGKVAMTGFQLSANPANGYVLTSDASGNGTWQQLPGGGGLTLPYAGTVSSDNPALSITNTSTYGEGFYAQGGAIGIFARSTNNGWGVEAVASGSGVGVYGGSDNGIGVYGVGNANTGGYFAGEQYGVNAYASYTAVYASGGGNGVKCEATDSGGNGIVAEADNGSNAFGVWGISTSGYAGWFDGNVYVTGTLSAANKQFKIDHPLDPAHKYLVHSCIESDQMANLYSGNVTTDASGDAIVTLPDWFEALNTDFRYQLTCIGQFAQAVVAAEIVNRSFIIKTSKPGVKVSWQVTGIRQDAWANAHRIPVEVDKSPQDQGHYIHPELFGHEGEPSIAEIRHPRPQPPQQ